MATHKISVDKLAKIRCLGINMIQVTVPKDSPEAIRKIFHVTNRTQWIYNHEQEKIKYIPVSKGDDSGVLPIDDFQRSLLESIESYECRKTQINNLIRGFRKCLEGEQFGNIIHSIRTDLHTVEGNTERAELKLREFQERIREQLEGGYKNEATSLEQEEGEFSNYENGLEQKYRDLEARYFEKRSELENEERVWWRKAADTQDSVRRVREEQESIQRKRERIQQAIEYSHAEYEGYGRANQGVRAGIGQRRSGLQEKYRKIEDDLRKEFDSREIKLRAEFQSKESKIGEEFESDKARIISEFDELRKQSIEAINSGDSSGCPRLTERFKGLLNARGNINDIEKKANYIRRMRKAKSILDSKGYQNWL